MPIENEEELEKEFNTEMQRTIHEFRKSKFTAEEVWQMHVQQRVKEEMPDLDYENRELWQKFKKLREKNKDNWIEKFEEKRRRWRDIDDNSNFKLGR